MVGGCMKNISQTSTEIKCRMYYTGIFYIHTHTHLEKSQEVSTLNC